MNEENAKRRAEEKLVKEITQDFEKRREERRSIESGWLLNMNFYCGNQYCDVSPMGGVAEEDAQFYWQSRRVFNHVAPMVEARLAKLEKKRPKIVVRAFSDEDGDVKSAKLATGVLNYAQERIGFSGVASKVIAWAEICGSGFYKIAWNEQGGRKVAETETGEGVFEGEVSVAPVSPFEIFPDNLSAENMDEVRSLIHARVVSVDEIYERFGVEVKGSAMADLTLTGYFQPTASKLLHEAVGGVAQAEENGVILIERYTRPTHDYPSGKLEIVAGDKLLFAGELPYQNGEKGERILPFVKQDCIQIPGAFFGSSVIDRLIPVQRAYNAVRNRKHEFLNRVSMGVLTVEDGSVDTDELTEEGLLPGKVLVYRQGAKAPEMLDAGAFPSEFSKEEEWLEKEFSLISGVSDLSKNSTPNSVTSATGLQLLINQDETRLSATLKGIENAFKEVGRQILRLYKEFAGSARLMTMTGENKRVQVRYFNATDLSISDVAFETEEMETPEEKREMILRLYQAGLLTDDDGKMSLVNKNRVLEAFGFGGYENARDISALHIVKAGEENLQLKKAETDIDEYDDHSLHIVEHTRYLLSSDIKQSTKKDEIKKRFALHMQAHKQALKKQETEKKEM